MAKPPLSYRAAGVDIDAGQRLVERIKGAARATHRPEVIGGIGGYAALFAPPAHYREPVVASTTDGVGTKLKLALALGRHYGIGIDLVAMCANDLLVVGAEPMIFLDYYASGKLDVDAAAEIIGSIAEGCKLAGCTLAGGETAELPGLYRGADYDLAGFCVGLVERAAVIDGRAVRPGDQLIGLPSSGLHANGYSLVRAVLERAGVDLATAELGGRSLADQLLEPTRIYVKPLRLLFERHQVSALAHITGGGLAENLARVLPAGLRACIDAGSWTRPPIFDWLQAQGDIPAAEMWRTFNCGIGMVVVLPEGTVDAACRTLAEAGEQPLRIGVLEGVEPGAPPQVQIGAR